MFHQPNLEHLRDRQDVFSGIFRLRPLGLQSRSGARKRSVNGVYVSGQYFDTLGVPLCSAELWRRPTTRAGCAGGAVLSYGFWQSENMAAEPRFSARRFRSTGSD